MEQDEEPTEEAPKAKNAPYSDLQRKQALALISIGASQNHVAKTMSISRTTVKRWALRAAKDAKITEAGSSTERDLRLDDLINAALEGFALQIRTTSDPEFIKANPSVAHLYFEGQFDRILVLLHSIQEGAEKRRATTEPGPDRTGAIESPRLRRSGKRRVVQTRPPSRTPERETT